VVCCIVLRCANALPEKALLESERVCCSSVLQYVLQCVLQCVAALCNVLRWCVAVACCIVLQCVNALTEKALLESERVCCSSVLQCVLQCVLQ